MVEQPASSLFFSHPEIKHVIKASKAECIHIELGCFGADTAKPLKLVGTAPWLPDLACEYMARKINSVRPLRTLMQVIDGRHYGRHKEMSGHVFVANLDIDISKMHNLSVQHKWICASAKLEFWVDASICHRQFWLLKLLSIEPSWALFLECTRPD